MISAALLDSARIRREASVFSRLLCAATLLCGPPLASFAEPLQFAILAKRIDHPFFRLVGKGCAEAARAQGDSCLLLGSSGPAHFRLQNQALEQALGQDLDGIALSVIHSKWLAGHALKRLGRTPLITFDSDLGPDERHLRRGYVGLDNLAFGRQLGRLAQHFRPHGGRLCILSASPQDPNLQERLKGVRLQLRGIEGGDAEAERLSGKNGWHELERCPLYSANDQQSVLFQLTTLLNANQVDIVISLGSWPVHHPSEFRRQLGPLLAELDTKGTRPAIIVTTPEFDTARQALLDEGLIQAYLGFESREMGRQAYWMMKRLAQGLPVPERVLVDSHAHRSPKASNKASAP